MLQRLPLLALLLLAACAGNPATTPAAPSTGTVRGTLVDGSAADLSDFETGAGRVNSAAHAVAAPPDSAWPALIAAYGEIGLTVTGVDERSHTLHARQRVRRQLDGDRLSTFLDCGQNLSGTVADQYRVELEVSSALAPRPGGGSIVETAVAARAFNPQGSSSAPVACGSNGTLEARIAGLVGLRSIRY